MLIWSDPEKHDLIFIIIIFFGINNFFWLIHFPEGKFGV